MILNVVSRSRCFDGTQHTYQHRSSETGTMMRFAAFVPPQARQSPVPGGVVPVGSNLHRGKLHHQGRCATDRGRTWPPADCPRHKSARGWSTQTPMTVALSSLRLTGDWTRRPHTTELYCFHRHITPSFPEPVDERLQAQALGPGCATANTAPCWFTGMSQGLLLLFGPPYWVL